MTEPNDATIDLPDPHNPHEQETVAPSGSAAELAGILDGYMAELQAGKAPDRGELLAAHPDLAAQLEACLAGIEFVHRATGPAAEEPATLGEFRIVRELGRGGMGVVYEAEQTSLRRQVALKVLRFGVVADEEAMQRFHREAKTVARLHHTNIVPIFAIGCERGVHYYAMQLIVGRSLADVQEESQRTKKPLAVEDVGRWGLQAAEALAHAHQRGVIHRDIKPSNLLIDTDGVVWLTDFGLAKRADEVTMTASGALMGTPRYMSPEQAESLHRTIDHRTDVYSLGASLYELATGRPAFASTTPHGVVMQILTEEPPRPRQIRPELPRDLETIILSCLAKEPAGRYQTARELASDLLAVLEGRPIKARRVPLVERMTRYVQKRRKAISRGVLVVAATTLLIVGSFLGWRFYRDWRLGRVMLSTDGPPLRAEVLPESDGEPITEPFDVGTRTLLPLPAGDYRLRVTGTGLLGQTYRFAVNRGETRSHRVSLDEDRLLGSEPIPYSAVMDAVRLRGVKADFVEWTGQTLIRRDGATGQPIWDAATGKMILDGSRLVKQPWEPKRDPVAWLRRLSFFGDRQRPGKLVQPAPDLNGDGTGDLVWVIEGTPSFLALSGADGSLLWTYSAKPEGPGGPDPGGPAEPRRGDPIPLLSRVRGEPVAADVDGDGTADLMATFAFFDDPAGIWERTGGWATVRAHGVLGWLGGNGTPANRPVVVAVSGRTGRWLWNYPLARRQEAWDPADVSLSLVTRPKGSLVMVVDGSLCIPLDPATGKPRGQSIDLAFRPLGNVLDRPDRPVQFADLDGDGEPEVLAFLRSMELVAISSSTGQRLWHDSIRPAGLASPSISGFGGENLSIRSEWSLAADLDGDGRAEVVVPDRGPLRPGKEYGGVRRLDGATGQMQWTRPLSPGGTGGGVVHIVAGPDLDGDGTRDLVAVSRYDAPVTVYVDALSGRDGHPLWWWHAEFQGGSSLLVWPPRWWGRGPDGWPLLVVPLGGNLAPTTVVPLPNPPETPVVHFLSALTGREVHALDGLSWPKVADLDGDGIDDLWGSVDGQLRAFRGQRPEAWRVLGRFQPAGDLNGDGLADIVSADLNPPENAGKATIESRVAVARSGRDGRVLWKTSLETWGEEHGVDLATFPTTGDVDGDGAPDVVVSQRCWVRRKDGPPASVPLQILSGRSGRRLWSAGPLPIGNEAHGYSRVEGIDVCSSHAQGPSDVLVFYDSPFDEQTRLARISGRDGRVVWDVPLAEWHGLNVTGPARKFPREFGDLNGDGDPDVVLAIPVTIPGVGTTFELRAVSLTDGKSLWAQPIRFKFKGHLEEPIFAVGDLDGDGRAEVIVKDLLAAEAPAAIEVTAHEGRDGSTRWSWRGSPSDRDRYSDPLLLVDLEGKGHREVCISASREDRLASGPVDDQRFAQLVRELKPGEAIWRNGAGEPWRQVQRVVILDEQGHERLSRYLHPPGFHALASADLDGDGRAELLFHHSDRLRATRGNLQDLWTFPHFHHQPLREIIPARAGRSATLILNPLMGLDGVTGRPRWSGGALTAMLDAGGDTSLPRLLDGPNGATTCRLALRISAEGLIQPAEGEPVKPSLARDDPRWERPLPWVKDTSGILQLRAYLSLASDALMVVVVPLLILRFATRKRRGSVRLLIALPVALALPLAMVFYRFGSLIPLDDPSTWVALGDLARDSMAGLPILVYVIWVASAVGRWRWQRLAVPIGLTVLATVGIGLIWLRRDGFLATMLDAEHYNWSGWYLAVLPGAYAAGVLIVIGWVMRGMVRRAIRPRRTALVAAQAEAP